VRSLESDHFGGKSCRRSAIIVTSRSSNSSSDLDERDVTSTENGSVQEMWFDWNISSPFMVERTCQSRCESIFTPQGPLQTTSLFSYFIVIARSIPIIIIRWGSFLTSSKSRRTSRCAWWDGSNVSVSIDDEFCKIWTAMEKLESKIITMGFWGWDRAYRRRRKIRQSIHNKSKKSISNEFSRFGWTWSRSFIVIRQSRRWASIIILVCSTAMLSIGIFTWEESMTIALSCDVAF